MRLLDDATRSRTASSPRACASPASTRGGSGGDIWGYFDARRPRVRRLLRRQSRARRHHSRSRAAPSPTGCARVGPSLLVVRRPGRRGARPVAPAGAVAGARRARCAPDQPLLAIDARARRCRARPARAPRRRWTTSTSCSRVRRDVHRRGGRLPGGGRRRLRLPRAHRRDRPGAAQSSCGSTTACVVFKAEVGAVAGGRLPGAGRLGRSRATGAAGCRIAGWRRSSSMAAGAIAPMVSLYVNDYNTAARKAYAPRGLPRGGHVRDRPLLRRGGAARVCP